MGRRAPAVVTLVVVLATALAGCGGSERAEPPTTSLTMPTSAGTATPTVGTTTPTTSPVVPSTPIEIPFGSDGVSAAGSGCAPPAGDFLPDGLWFGQLKSVDVGSGTIGLDLACFFSGPAADAAAAADGESEIPVPNGYYIRNQVAKIYGLKAVPGVAVLKLSAGGGGPLVAAGTGLGAAAAMFSEFASYWIGWVQVSSGWVVVIQQQFVP